MGMRGFPLRKRQLRCFEYSIIPIYQIDLTSSLDVHQIPGTLVRSQNVFSAKLFTLYIKQIDNNKVLTFRGGTILSSLLKRFGIDIESRGKITYNIHITIELAA